MKLDSYFYLRDQYAFVTGARHAVIADFGSGSFQRPNEAARKIIELGEQGLTVAEAHARLKSEFNTSDILAFIETLSSEGLVTSPIIQNLHAPINRHRQISTSFGLR